MKVKLGEDLFIEACQSDDIGFAETFNLFYDYKSKKDPELIIGGISSYIHVDSLLVAMQFGSIYVYDTTVHFKRGFPSVKLIAHFVATSKYQEFTFTYNDKTYKINKNFELE